MYFIKHTCSKHRSFRPYYTKNSFEIFTENNERCDIIDYLRPKLGETQKNFAQKINKKPHYFLGKNAGSGNF